MRGALARMAAVLRGAVALAAVVSAVLGNSGALSWRWLVPAVILVAGWTAIYLTVAWSTGLRPWLVASDLAITAALCLAVGQLVPSAAIPGTVNWVATIASMSVVTAQLGGLPWIALPGGLITAIAYVAGARLARSPDGGVAEGILLISQATVAAAVMVVALSAERAAVRAFTGLQQAEDELAVAASRRDDERAQLRLVHNGPLTTLTMALHNVGPPGRVLRTRAAATLERLQELTGDAPGPAGQVRLDERLAVVLAWYDRLAVAATLRPCLASAGAAEAFTAAAAEALENVVRHAAVASATVELADFNDTIILTVKDAGRGFDAVRQLTAGFGLREDVVARMAAVGGSATISSAPGAGTAVRLEWRRD